MKFLVILVLLVIIVGIGILGYRMYDRKKYDYTISEDDLKNMKATVYEDINYTGKFVPFPVGKYSNEEIINYENRLFENNMASSIQIPQYLEVILYENDNLTGSSQKFVDSVPNLVDHGWNDRMTSLEIKLKDNVKVI